MRLYSYLKVWIIIVHDYVNVNVFQVIQKMEKKNENTSYSALDLTKLWIKNM